MPKVPSSFERDADAFHPGGEDLSVCVIKETPLGRVIRLEQEYIDQRIRSDEASWDEGLVAIIAARAAASA